MRGDLIALDLETTGLDVTTDSIVEIGAVRLRDGQIVAEYETLINPGFVIPAETTHITGIHQDDLRKAPMLTAVLPDLKSFVGSAPIIAHNVSFDIAFMRRFGLFEQNLPIDTLDLATVLLPNVPRYSLSSLTAYFDIELTNAHRALDDARATAILYWKLWEKALALPDFIKRELVAAMSGIHWDSGRVFSEAFHETRGDESGNLGSTPELFGESVTNGYMPEPITVIPDVDGLLDAWQANGSFSDTISTYEDRSQQVEMSQLVVAAFREQKHIMIEAGTGIGKSLAYLLPAVWWSLKTGQQVVISTNTINLQDQLQNSEAAILQQMIDTEFRVAVMKGRKNYLCPHRLDALRRQRVYDLDEVRMLAKILIWLNEQGTGDRSEISLRGAEYGIWQRLSADDEECTVQRCSLHAQVVCPFMRARRRAESSHVVITNHALLVSDALSEHHVLPEYRHLIIDEAHQLEEAITSGLSLRVDMSSILRRLKDLGGVNSGVLGEILRIVKDSLPEKHVLQLVRFIQDIGAAASAATAHVRGFYSAVFQYVEDHGNQMQRKIRLDNKRRSSGDFAIVASQWDSVDGYLRVLIDALDQIVLALGKQSKKYTIKDIDFYLNIVTASGYDLRRMENMLHGLIHAPDKNMIYWIVGASSIDMLALYAAPLHVGSLMEDAIWQKKETVVMTGATLRTGDDFSYLRDRLYAEDVEGVVLGSPYDYKESVLVYIPDDLPMPNESGYQRAVERGIVELAAGLNGRVMALFTSYAQLRETAANISARLALGNIVVYDQATGGSRESLLENFKSTEKAVLLGTKSFWEGVDIPGPDLSALVIVRLPFAVPSEPVFAARSATYSNAFDQYAVPDAILRFRQGFGRLIRSQSDRGVVAIFDSRIIHKSYGKRFLESLPETTIQYGQLRELATAASQWLAPK